MPRHGGERRRRACHLGRLHDCRSSAWSEIIDLHRISHEGDEVNGEIEGRNGSYGFLLGFGRRLGLRVAALGCGYALY